LQLKVQKPTEQVEQEQQVFTSSQTPTVASPTSTVSFTARTEALLTPTVALPTSVSPKTAAVTLTASTSSELLPPLLPTLLPPTLDSSEAPKSVSISNDNAPNNALRTTPTASTAPATDTGTVVDFFEAPLLTAFTVQQDSAGVPRRVIPIFTEPGQLERQKILALETREESGDNGDRNTVEPDRSELELLKSVELSKQRLQSVPSREELQQRESFAVQQQLRFQQQLQQRAAIEEQQLQQIVQQRQLQLQQQQLQLQQQQQEQQQQQRQRQQQQQQQRAVVFQPQQQPQQQKQQPQQQQQQQQQPQQQQQQKQLQLQLQPVQGQLQQQPNQFVQQQRLQFGDGPLALLPQFAQQQTLQQQRVNRQPQSQSFGYGLSVPRLPGDLDVVYKVLALNHEGRNDNAVGPQPLLF